MQLTTIFIAMAVLLLAAPVAGQEGTDTTVYMGAPVPVWVEVADVEGEAGAHAVSFSVEWADARSGLPFSLAIKPGDLAVLLPRTKDADETDLREKGCRFVSGDLEHGETSLHSTERKDSECTSPLVEFMPLVGVEYMGHPMACEEATLKGPRREGPGDPGLRLLLGGGSRRVSEGAPRPPPRHVVRAGGDPMSVCVYRERGAQEALLTLLEIAFNHLTLDLGEKYKALFQGDASTLFLLIKDELHGLPTEDHLLKDFERGFAEGVESRARSFPACPPKRAGGHPP